MVNSIRFQAELDHHGLTGSTAGWALPAPRSKTDRIQPVVATPSCCPAAQPTASLGRDTPAVPPRPHIRQQGCDANAYAYAFRSDRNCQKRLISATFEWR